MASVQALIRRVTTSVTAHVARLPVLRQDALLYTMAAVFSAGESVLAVTADYREWGRIAAVPYLLAAVACEVIYRRRHNRKLEAQLALDAGDEASSSRRLLVLGVLVFVVMLPLGLQVTWRADAGPRATSHNSAQAQPEVAVIERAGDRFDHFADPYLSRPGSVGVSPPNDHRSVDADSYFPYLPGMVLFGVANAANVPAELNDARLELAGFTLIVVSLALLLVPSSGRRRWRTFQFLIVLPTGALPIVTGGDDLPVLALLLLGLVFVQRRQPVAAGLAMGFAGTLKWTAWPLILLAVLCVRDEEDRPAMLRYSLAVLLVVVPVVGAGVALGAHAFFENVVLFPLGLTKLHSPAASPLPGQVLVQLFPASKRAITAALLGSGTVAVLVMLVCYPPRTAYEAARFSGWALAFATIIAPATRFGYLIYPANMLVWAYLLHLRKGESVERPLRRRVAGEAAEAAASGQLASSTW
ncbi:MAG: hypothetical protein ACLQK4_17160 [Acidimicrobiales bacterium]